MSLLKMEKFGIQCNIVYILYLSTELKNMLFEMESLGCLVIWKLESMSDAA